MRTLSLTLLAATAIATGFGQLASAADMPVKAARAPVFTAYNWSGIYFGGNIGYATGRSSWTDDPTLTGADLGSHRLNNAIFGGQIGVNLQVTAWVVGVEADMNWGSLKGAHVDQFLSDLNTKTKSLGTASARLGYAFDMSLLYLKIGAAWGQFNYDDFVTAGGALNGQGSATRAGYVIGGGWEYAFAANWSAKIEYNYIDFGTKTITFNGGVAAPFVQGITERFHVVKAGVNYHLNP
jgi:outer membrane immunogenic protein